MLRRADIPCPDVWCEQFGLLVVAVDPDEDYSGSSWVARCTACGAVQDERKSGGTPHLGGLFVKHELGRPRQWLVDANGFPVECCGCPPGEQVLATRKAIRLGEMTGLTCFTPI